LQQGKVAQLAIKQRPTIEALNLSIAKECANKMEQVQIKQNNNIYLAIA